MLCFMSRHFNIISSVRIQKTNLLLVLVKFTRRFIFRFLLTL